MAGASGVTHQSRERKQQNQVTDSPANKVTKNIPSTKPSTTCIVGSRNSSGIPKPVLNLVPGTLTADDVGTIPLLNSFDILQ